MNDRSTAVRPGSWEEVVDVHSARVERLAYRLTGNRADAEDLTQDVFVRAFRSLGGFRQGTSGTMEGWLHRITTNLFLDQVRRRARLRFDPVAEVHDARLERVTALHTDPVDGLLEGDVETALSQLAPELRAAVVLSDIEGLSYEEVAAVLDVPLGTVRSRLHRGRSQLRRSLAHRAPTAGRLRHAGPSGDGARRP
jgi:RNA polymerase sigma-70 factor (ECF subfamily)